MHRLVGLKKLRIPNSQRISAPRRGCLIRTCPGLGKSPFSQCCRRFGWHGSPEFRLWPCRMHSRVCQVLCLHVAHIARYLCAFSLCAACSGTGSGMHSAKARGRREGGSNFLSVRAFVFAGLPGDQPRGALQSSAVGVLPAHATGRKKWMDLGENSLCRGSGLQDDARCQAHLRSEGLPEDCDLKSQGPEAVILVGTTLQSRGRLRIRGPVQLRLRLDAQHLVLVCRSHSRQSSHSKAVWPCRREVFDLRRCRCGELGFWGSSGWRSRQSLGSEDEEFERHRHPAFRTYLLLGALLPSQFPADPSPGEGQQSKQPRRCLVGTRFESRARFWCFFLGRRLAGLVASPLLASPFRSLEGAVLKIRNSTAGSGGGFYAKRLSLEPCHMSWA